MAKSESKKKMLCPDCGVEMNHHAEKLIYKEMVALDSDFTSDEITEVHACPECGKTHSRKA